MRGWKVIRRWLLCLGWLLTLAGGAAERPDGYRLREGQAAAMSAIADVPRQRWADILGNFYTGEFARGFAYRDARVLVAYDARGTTLRGRLEARGLKPNFAYQLKLMGDAVRDPAGFAIIGRLGRWLVPNDGIETHFTEEEVRRRGGIAYLFFAYFVTDANGHAALDFVLERSHHVVWNLAYDGKVVPGAVRRKVVIDASDPAVYSLPKAEPIPDELWTEPDPVPGVPLGGVVTLPPRVYRAKLALTEESLHSWDRDGGWWATVLELPIEFEIAVRNDDKQP